ncbi:MAG TPA: protein kinase, partial [Candidatus Polarisedimenticolia bacterium]|nr:protein kinase [Candidatus Polarisedimenticolia bacterium]
MSLTAGTRLGQYSIDSPLGAGGMGEVYRARDTKLGREVALKVLPDLFARDSERLARFQQEARLLAALNHPHIAAIYGLEEAECQEPSGHGAAGERAGQVRFLVLELVPGETLAERIARGALPVDEALAVCRQIAEGLEAAHERGIIHRDLKPANIKITPEGKVKVLDFGLAKAFAPHEASPGTAPVDLMQSPTLTTPATQVGAILGTAAYMSPEQARGRPVDKRADIWAFGCVLYEALTGRQAFEGETLSDTLAAILKSEPDWEALPSDAGSRLRELLKRCLRKDPGQRLRDIGDARQEIEAAIAAGPSGAAGQVDAGSSHRRRASLFIPWVVAGAMAAVAATLLWSFWIARVAPQGSGRPVHLSVALPPSTRLPSFTGNTLAISPDGSDLIYVASTGNDSPRLYRRPLSSPTATPMPDTEGAWGPLFSPDGKWVGFAVGRKLRKTPVTGGSAITICDGCEGTGFAWGPDGSILIGTIDWELKSVSAAGGEPRSVLTLGDQAPFSQGVMAWPQVIDDGGSILCSLRGRAQAFDQAMLGIVRVRGNSGAPLVTRLPERGTSPRYLPTGHILFVRGGTLLAMPFGADRATVVGPA